MTAAKSESLIDPADLQIEVWPHRGSGGQHVGTESGIRVTHIPSGLVAISNIERSQHRNREIAISMIE